MSTLPSKIIFTREDKEHDYFRDKLKDYLNKNKSYFKAIDGSEFSISVINELSLDNFGTGEFYHLVCDIIVNGEIRTTAYSMDPRTMTEFLRREKIKQIKERI